MTRSPYGYANGDPLMGLDVLTFLPFVGYYGSYEAAHGINWVGDRLGTPGRVVSHVVALPLVIPEAVGLGVDVGIDWIKGHTVNHESICDEGKRGYVNPFHRWVPGPLKGPQTYLPGVHSDGSIDFEW